MLANIRIRISDNIVALLFLTILHYENEVRTKQ